VLSARTAAVALLAAALAGACGGDNSRVKSDWEIANESRLLRDQNEAAGIEPPAYPGAEGLLRFSVSSASDFSFFVDSASLSVGKDRIVRYTLVARSPSGVDNVSYEGISCIAGEFTIYAIGLRDATWRAVAPQWKPIERKGVQRWHSVLAQEYFCPNGSTIADAAEGLSALKQGGHPLTTLRSSSPGAR
jgi:hypothetical protein